MGAGSKGRLHGAWLEAPDGTGQGIRVWLNGNNGYQVYSLAEQLQEWMVDQGATWPPCPVHLDAGHRLETDIRDDVAVWWCPRSGQTVAAVGSLPSPRASRGPGSVVRLCVHHRKTARRDRAHVPRPRQHYRPACRQTGGSGRGAALAAIVATAPATPATSPDDVRSP